ncbi:hypothetical protein ACH4NF_26650 [Streptomyces sp. NPDC017248]|uniref:hypothetical protein n=1 Tax=unclassified Streptomyces TaxID=2593676 RepID=UPI0037954478
MTAPSRPLLKSITPAPDQPPAAEPAAPRPAVGEPKGAARQGVPSALRPDQHPANDRYPVAWLTVTAPYGGMPVAASQCWCGWDHSAIGHAQVRALIEAHATHRATCPLRNPREGRAAA